MENCTLALRAIEVLDAKREILPKVLAKGVEQTFWPGRMEEVLPEIFVDGAHNADGVRAFLETSYSIFKNAQNVSELYIKNYENFFKKRVDKKGRK